MSNYKKYKLAEIYRKKKIPTVIGSIHASMLPDEALQFVDAVVIGEAESIWEKVILDFENAKDRKNIRDSLYRMTRLSDSKII